MLVCQVFQAIEALAEQYAFFKLRDSIRDMSTEHTDRERELQEARAIVSGASATTTAT